MCFGGGGGQAPAIPPAPPPPPAPPAPIAPPAPPPPAPVTPPQRTDIEASRVRPPSADVEAKRRVREGTTRLKKKMPQDQQTLRTTEQQTAAEGAQPTLNVSGSMSPAGGSLNIQRQ